MSNTAQLNAALELALQLEPDDRLRLVTRVVASVEQDMFVGARADESKANQHWGQSLNRLLDALDISDWEALEIDDPVAWVKALRRQEESRLDGYWTGAQ